MILHPPDTIKNTNKQQKNSGGGGAGITVTLGQKNEIPSPKLPLDVDKKIRIQEKEDRAVRIHSRKTILALTRGSIELPFP